MFVLDEMFCGLSNFYISLYTMFNGILSALTLCNFSTKTIQSSLVQLDSFLLLEVITRQLRRQFLACFRILNLPHKSINLRLFDHGRSKSITG